jgi:hypothetical protein
MSTELSGFALLCPIQFEPDGAPSAPSVAGSFFLATPIRLAS